MIEPAPSDRARCAVCGVPLNRNNRRGVCCANDPDHRRYRGLPPHVGRRVRRRVFGETNPDLARGRCRLRQDARGCWNVQVWTGTNFVIIGTWRNQQQAHHAAAEIHRALRDAILTDRSLSCR